MCSSDLKKRVEAGLIHRPDRVAKAKQIDIRGKADPCDRPQKIKSKDLTSSLSRSCGRENPSRCVTQTNCIHSGNPIRKGADSGNRPKIFSPYVLPVFSIDLTGDGKLGYGFTSADELEEVDIGPGDKPRPTFISKKLDPNLRDPMIALLREYPDCFAWDYTEMPGLDRSIIEHRLPLKKGFRPYQQRARQMKAEILEEVKKEIEKMLKAGFIRPCRYAEWIDRKSTRLTSSHITRSRMPSSA